MCQHTCQDSNSADPAVYEDFSDCLNSCFAETEKMDFTTAFNASIKFLKMYRDAFGFELSDFIDRFSIDLYKNEFEKQE